MCIKSAGLGGVGGCCFNQPLQLWDVSIVTNMDGMFWVCASIKRDPSHIKVHPSERLFDLVKSWRSLTRDQVNRRDTFLKIGEDTLI